VLLLFAAAARGQEADSVSVIVPVVGSVIGPNATRWVTDVELRNDMRTEATVALSLPAAPDQPVILLTMPPGAIQRFSDVAGEAFSMQNILSPLVVQTLGRRSIRVLANARGIRGTEVSPPQAIPVMDPAAHYPLRILSGLQYSDAFRTNIGLVNLGDREAVFSLALQVEGGQMSGGTRAVVPANSMWHMAIQLVFPTIKKDSTYAVLVESGAANTYAYASVLENATNTARFVVPGVTAK
jgi:hypothetical protein